MCGGELQTCGGCGKVECREVVRNHLVFNECREVVRNHLVFNLTRSTFLKASINWHRLRSNKSSSVQFITRFEKSPKR